MIENQSRRPPAPARRPAPPLSGMPVDRPSSDLASVADVAPRAPSRLARISAALVTGIIVLLAIFGTVFIILLVAGNDRYLPAALRTPPAAPPAPAGETPASAPAPARQADAPRPSLARANGLIPGRAFVAWRDRTFDPLDLTVDYPTTFIPAITPQGVTDYPDGGTIVFSDLVVRLSGIVVLGRNEVCVGEDGLKYACGLAARASIGNFIRNQRLVCYRDVALETAVNDFQCSLGRRDLAQYQLRQGFALPSRPSIEAYNDLVQAARDAKAGAWKGGYEIMTFRPRDVAPTP